MSEAGNEWLHTAQRASHKGQHRPLLAAYDIVLQDRSASVHNRRMETDLGDAHPQGWIEKARPSAQVIVFFKLAKFRKPKYSVICYVQETFKFGFMHICMCACVCHNETKKRTRRDLKGREQEKERAENACDVKAKGRRQRLAEGGDGEGQQRRERDRS